MNRRDALRSLLTLPAVASVSVAQVRPEDTIVITVDQHLSVQAHDRIASAVKAAFPGSRACVLEKGVSLSVVRQA